VKKSGIVLVDKPAGISSAAVVARVKRQLQVDRCGHAGTLDPMATGLLVCLVNSATRLARFAEGGMKEYEGRLQWGLTSSTDDTTGEILERSELRPSHEAQRAAVGDFTGEIFQVPPKVSAIKVDGERAYRLSRSGVEFELKARPVTIHSFDLTPDGADEASFRVVCTAGTYVRSIVRDLGTKFGCGAAMSALRRTGSFPFQVSQAVPLESVEASALRDWGELFPTTETLQVSEKSALRLLGGSVDELRKVMEAAESENAVTPSARYVVYKLERTGGSLGLLERSANGWAFAANVG
jgi:tRNA pseudouridine55 synthase